MMLRKSFILMTVVSLVGCSTVHRIDREPAGLKAEPLSISKSCVADVTAATNGSSRFDVETFQNTLQDFEKKGAVTDEDVKYAAAVPERLLALIEYQSRKDAYEGFGFAERLKTMKKRDLKRLFKLMIEVNGFSESDNDSVVDAPLIKLTKAQQENLLAEIYDVIHKPTGLFRGVWKYKSVRDAYAQIRLEKIKKRLELSLFYEGMPKTFEVITADPGMGERFREAIKPHRAWINPLLAFSIWLPFAIYAPEFISQHGSPDLVKFSQIVRWLPPIIPTFTEFFEKIITKEDLELLTEKGPDVVAQRINERSGRKFAFGQGLRTFTGAYMTVFTLVTVAAISANTAVEAKYRMEQKMQTRFERTVHSIGELADQKKMTAEQIAAADAKRGAELLSDSDPNDKPDDADVKAVEDLMQRHLAIAQQHQMQLEQQVQKKKPSP